MLTKSQQTAVDKIRKLIDVCHNPAKNNLSLFEIAEENEKAIYVHYIVHWTGMGNVDGFLYKLFTEESIIRVTKRGVATFLDRNDVVHRFHFDRKSMIEAEFEFKLPLI